MSESDTGLVVVDSGPIIGLSIVGQLPLLRAISSSVLAPGAVFQEVVETGTGRPGASELEAAAWIERATVSPPPDPLLARELGAGEAEVIALAVQRAATLVILDDRRARRVAELAYGLRVRGTAALVVEAKRRGLIVAARPVLEAMTAGGYFLSSRLVEWACRAAGE
ncbi:DUF3368 domain-containing protein [Planctomycetota bacterium]